MVELDKTRKLILTEHWKVTCQELINKYRTMNKKFKELAVSINSINITTRDITISKYYHGSKHNYQQSLRIWLKKCKKNKSLLKPIINDMKKTNKPRSSTSNIMRSSFLNKKAPSCNKSIIEIKPAFKYVPKKEDMQRLIISVI